MKKKIVKMEMIVDQMATILETTAFDLSLNDLGNNSIDIFKTTDFYDDMCLYYLEKSVQILDNSNSEIVEFTHLWTNFKNHYMEEWQRIFTNSLIEYDPLSEYHEKKKLTPDLTTTTDFKHAHVIDYAIDHHDDETGYGGKTTSKINTYDGTEHNASESSNSGKDTRKYKETNKTTNSGTDTTTAKATGTSTETIDGYKNSPAKALSDDIIFHVRCNIRDLVIKQFANDFLFYDNDNDYFHNVGWY